MMIKEHEQVVLNVDVQAHRLKAGDVGTVVHCYEGGKAIEVEFFALTGDTIDVVTLESSQVREISENDVTHARPVHAAA